MIAQKKIIASIAAVVLTAAAFWYVNGNYRSSEDENKTKETQRTYTQITAHKAKEIMDTENDYIILDVRTQEEYSSGHMKDAVCLPNEEIVNEPDILPDKAQNAITELEYSCGPQNPLPLYSPYGQMPDQEWEEFVLLYREIAAITENSSGLVLIEPLNRYESPYLNTVHDCVELLTAVDHSSTGLLLDYFHMSIEEENLSESTLSAGKWVRHVHLGDSNRLLPGYGHTDFRACFSALKEIGYHGFVSLECAVLKDPYTELTKTSAFLSNFL